MQLQFNLDYNIIYRLMQVVSPNNPLEEALNNLTLEGTLVLISLLSQKAVYMQQQETKGKTKILSPKTIIT